jgi:succinate-acetate transporter protein
MLFSGVNLTSFANFWKIFAKVFDITKLELKKTKRKN